MIEQETNPANFFEKKAVDFLLFLKPYLAKKPETKLDHLIDRRRFFQDGLQALFVLSASLVGLATLKLITATEEAPPNLPNPQPAESITDKYFGISWINNEEVKVAIDHATTENLTVLTTQLFQIRIIEKAVFKQASNGAVIAIDEQAFTKWSGQTGAKDYMTAFVFKDATTARFRVSGAQNIGIRIDELWDQNVFGRNKSQLFSEFANSISSAMAAGADAIDRYGYEKISIASLDHTSKEWQWGYQRYQYYMQLFSKKQMDPFIKVVALNPLWIRDKLR